ncbi:MAG: type II toxin-antitoxin system HicA family toxin [Chloroflexota bacterium]
METLLMQFGFTLARIKGSHHVFQYQQGEVNAIMVVPVHRNTVKPQYVKDSLELLDELFPIAVGQLEDDDDDSQ